MMRGSPSETRGDPLVGFALCPLNRISNTGVSVAQMPRRIRFALRLLAIICVFGFALFTTIAAFGRFHWAAELLTHFRVQATAAGILIAVVCGMLRMRVGTIVACVLVAVHAYPLLPYLLPMGPTLAPGNPQVRLLQINVHTANRDHQAVLRAITDTAPDIVGLVEVSERWLTALAPLHGRYPYRIEHPRGDNFGIALFSRFPIENLQLRPLQPDGSILMITGDFSLGSVPVTIAVAHPVPPVSGRYWAHRNSQLDQLSKILRQFDDREIILLGDLNTTPWSPTYHRFEQSADLKNGARGLGLFLTWPSSLPLLMIPIDHCLVSSGLRVTSFEVGSPLGSDHLPVLVAVAPQ